MARPIEACVGCELLYDWYWTFVFMRGKSSSTVPKVVGFLHVFRIPLTGKVNKVG